jgi:hypothetical protein
MATAEEKQALGLGPDASEADISARIQELTEAAQLAASAVRPDELERAQKEAEEQRVAREEAERALADVQAQSAAQLAGLQDQLASAQQASDNAIRKAPGPPPDPSMTGSSATVSAHPVAQTSTRDNGVPGGNEITIKIRAFPYYVDVEDPVTLRAMREERIATRGMTVSVSDLDYRRAVKFNAFYSDEELAVINIARPSELTLADATVADISNWLQTAKPTIPVILDEVNNDPTTAQKVIEAENLATGDQPRTTLIDQLEEIIEG